MSYKPCQPLRLVVFGDEARCFRPILERKLQRAQRAAQKFFDQIALGFERRIGNRKTALRSDSRTAHFNRLASSLRNTAILPPYTIA